MGRKSNPMPSVGELSSQYRLSDNGDCLMRLSTKRTIKGISLQLNDSTYSHLNCLFLLGYGYAANGVGFRDGNRSNWQLSNLYDLDNKTCDLPIAKEQKISEINPWLQKDVSK
jgi:hypothetical protein